MYTILHGLLADRTEGVLFTCFSPWHLVYIALACGAAWAVLRRIKNKPQETKEKTARAWINAAFGLYVADFFLMPLAYGEIDVEKLPFHACTAMCVACFLSYRSGFFRKYRSSFVLLGFLSNLVYLIYPAGVMWHQVHPLSYRVIQTLVFHAVMTVYGVAALGCEEDTGAKKWREDLTVLAAMVLWAMAGNAAYNGTSEGYSHFFNWFFVVRDPFSLLPEKAAPYIMPWLNIAVFFAAERLARFVLKKVGRKKLRVCER